MQLTPGPVAGCFVWECKFTRMEGMFNAAACLSHATRRLPVAVHQLVYSHQEATIVHPKRTRWLWTRLIACLLLGAAMNWPLGWLMVAFDFRDPFGPVTAVSVQDSRVPWPPWVPASWPALTAPGEHDRWRTSYGHSNLLTEECTIRASAGSADESRTTDEWETRELRAGWPLRSLSMGSMMYRAGVSAPWTTTESPHLPIHRWGIKADLPICVLPPGLIVNSVVYACVFAIGLTACRAVVRRLDRRRRLCVRCSYNITGLATCPECGTPIAESASPL